MTGSVIFTLNDWLYSSIRFVATGGFGQGCVVVGVFFVILHLNKVAAIVFVATAISVLVLIPLFALIGLLVYGVIQYRKKQQEKRTVSEPEKQES